MYQVVFEEVFAVVPDLIYLKISVGSSPPHPTTNFVDDRFEPTTRECFMCGHKEPMSLSNRMFNCSNCGFSTNRD